MGLLDQLWDDTVAGPPPESGLGRLRKHSFRRPYSATGSDGGSAETLSDEAMRVTHTIMIGTSSPVSPPDYQIGSPPVSPVGTSPPLSPFSGSYFGSREDQHRMPSRRPTRLDEGALILLTTCEM